MNDKLNAFTCSQPTASKTQNLKKAKKQIQRERDIHIYIQVHISSSQEMDGEKSKKALPAIIESMDPKKVGVRRIGVRFVDDGVLQWVPADWLTPSWHLGMCGIVVVMA